MDRERTDDYLQSGTTKLFVAVFVLAMLAVFVASIVISVCVGETL